MKKVLLSLTALLFILFLAGCPHPDLPAASSTPETLTDFLNVGGNVDLQNNAYSENATVFTTGITISNADLGGRTLTVNARNVTLQNITNANLIIGEAVGDGDVFIEGCSFNTVTVNGGGANSIHFKTTTISRVEVKKTSVRVVLEESTSVGTAEISGDHAKLEASDGSSASVGTVEIANNTNGVQIKQVEATTIVVKENVRNVVVKDVTADKIEVKENAQNTTIESAHIATIEIEKEVEKIEMRQCTVETAVVSNEAGNVEVSGGTMTKLQVVKTKTTTEVKAVITVTKAETVIENAEVVVSNGQILTQPVTVVVPEQIQAEVTLPPTVEKVTITSAELDVNLVQTNYKTGTLFNKSNIYMVLSYSNNKTNRVLISPDAITVSGFSSAQVADNQTVTITASYNGENYSETVAVAISQMPDYINHGINLILSGLFDEGVDQFYTFYEENPDSDEAKMFYSLAEIATLSTDRSVAKLLRDHFALTDYPATMNALFSSEWMQEYQKRDRISTFTIIPDQEGYYFRCDIDQSHGTNEYRIESILDEDGDWINATTWEWDPDEMVDIRTELFISGTVIPSDTGRYLISSNYIIIDDFNSQYRYRREIANEKWVLASRTTALPKIAMSDWFKNSQSYRNSLLKGVENTETVSEALLAGIIDCNPVGMNGLVDDCLALFNNPKIANARSIANSIEDNVELPAQLVSAFHLEHILGEDEVWFGKAEFNILMAALDLIKGTLQYISSYDLSANVAQLRSVMMNGTGMTDEAAIALIADNTLAVRNASALTAAKTTYCNVIDTIVASYDAMFGTSGYYPQALKEMVQEYGNKYRPGLISLKSAIQGNNVFYIPMSNGMPSWEADPNPNTDLGIDFGKFFTPGYFSNIIERDAQRHVTLYEDYSYHFNTYGVLVTDAPDIPNAINPDILNPPVEGVAENSPSNGRTWYDFDYLFYSTPVLKDTLNEEEIKDTILETFIASNYQRCWLRFDIGYKINSNLINDLFVNLPEGQQVRNGVLNVLNGKTYTASHFPSFPEEIVWDEN